ncbi:type I polyketide synthase, partial [Streptomyces narbonensis]
YWYRNLRHRVRFAPAIETLATTEGFTHFIEVSAHPVLTMALPDTVTGLSTLRREQGGRDRLITSLAEAWANGLPVDWTSLLPATTTNPDLPTYAFRTERFWLQSSAPAGAADDWRYRVEWKPLTASGQAALTGRWLVAAGSEPDAGLLGALKDAGAEVEVLEAGADDGREALAARLAALTTGDGFAGVVSLLDGLTPFVAWVQALGDAGIGAPLWCVTRGAVSVGRLDVPADPDRAMLWGLGRVVALEHPERWGGLVDLPARPDTAALTHFTTALSGSTGEDQIAVRASGLHARRLARAPLQGRRPARDWQPHGTVLVTGGTGALGGHAARWLAQRGADHLLLVSRSGEQAPGADDLADELRALGARVTVAACDVADPDAMRAVLDGIPADAPLTAVLHTAGAPGGDALDVTGPEDIARILGAKTSGARVLDDLLRGTPLDAFVLYSSNAGVWGSGGQGVYAAANAHLDALAARRRARGETATSVAWGLWAGDGMGRGADDAYWQRRGIRPMSPERAMDELAKALCHDETFVAVADVDWARFAPAFTVSRPSLLIDGVPEARQALAAPAAAPAPGEAAAAPSGLSSALAGIAALPEPERRPALLTLVRTHAAAVLGHSSPDRVAPGRAFTELGFDSLTAVQLRNQLSAVVGSRLPATAVFDNPTPSALAAHLHERYLAPAEPAPADWEARVRQALAEVPLDRLRDAGVLDTVLRLTGIEPEPVSGGPADGAADPGAEPEPETSIDDLDAEALIRMALGPRNT